MKPARHPRGGRFAFTLLELLVVIAIILLLAALLSPALSAAKARARATRCMSNMRQFALASHLYAADHNDLILANKGGSDAKVGETWVQGWLASGLDCTNTLYLGQSLVAPYLPTVSVWRCPASRDCVLIEGQTFSRVRTLSMNHFMGRAWTFPRCATYQRLSNITRPAPSDAFVFIEERPETINDATFAVSTVFDPATPDGWIMKDLPSVNHRGAANLTFADGHIESHRWLDSRTSEATTDDAYMPGSRDVRWLAEHSTHWKND